MSTDALPLPDPALLPDDPAVLKQLVVQLLEELQKANARLERQEHHMHLLLKRIYGSTSEKLDPQQGVLFDAQAGRGRERPPARPCRRRAATAGFQEPRPARPRADSRRRSSVRKSFTIFRRPRRRPWAARRTWSNCRRSGASNSTGGPRRCSSSVHVRKKYARKEQLPESGLTLAEQNVAVARKPPEAIPGGLAGPGLMAQVIVSKGADHLPLHRLEGIFKRQGVRISRQTMDGWWLQTAEFFQPLYALAIRVVLASHVIHTDDTSVKVRDAWQKLKYTGRFWPYVGDPLHPLTVFDYTTNHQRDGPAAFLKDYRGYLQADAFNGYDGIYLESQGRIIEVGCWAHARRKFHESRRLDPARMETALAWIGKLYAIEKDLRRALPGRVAGTHAGGAAPRGSPPSGRSDRRPLLDGFHAWLEAEAPKVLPKSDGSWGDGLHARTTGRPCPCTPTTAGWTSTTTKARTRCGASAWDAATGSSVGATAAAARRRSISACWPPASVTAMIPGSTTATCSPACRRCSPAPARKNFSPCSPTAGIPPDLLRPPSPRRPAISSYVFRRTLTKNWTESPVKAACVSRRSRALLAVSCRYGASMSVLLSLV